MKTGLDYSGAEIGLNCATVRPEHNVVTVGNGTDVGLFLHPVLAVDADDGSCLGLVHAQIWRRKKRRAANYRELPIGANAAKQLLITTAAWVTIVLIVKATSSSNGCACRMQHPFAEPG